MVKKKAFVSWSGGKDIALSFYRARQSGDLEITRLLNMASEDGSRSRSHGISSKILQRQADAIGVRLVQGLTGWDRYEDEFKKALSSFREEGIETGVFGDIDLQQHRDWVERVSAETGITAILPLWNEKRQVLVDEFLGAGFKAVVVATDAGALGSEWLGRSIDESFIRDLKALGTIDLCGEKGEFHTFVYDGPIFKKPVEFVKGKKSLRDEHWFLEII
jgi:uncharacterized protein (TIGR00290 family)